MGAPCLPVLETWDTENPTKPKEPGRLLLPLLFLPSPQTMGAPCLPVLETWDTWKPTKPREPGRLLLPLPFRNRNRHSGAGVVLWAGQRVFVLAPSLGFPRFPPKRAPIHRPSEMLSSPSPVENAAT